MAEVTGLSVVVTDEKIETIGNRLAGLMNAVNQYAANLYPDSIRPSMGEEDHISGIAFALDTLGIPCKFYRSQEDNCYTAAIVLGRAFRVSDSDKEATLNG